MKLTPEERETIITKAQDEDGWQVYSEIPKHVRALSKLALRGGFETQSDPSGSIQVTLPEAWVCFRKPKKMKPKVAPSPDLTK